MTETRLNFKDMCEAFDVTPRTLRYYESIELLDPEREGRSRFYGPRELARMKLILRGRRFGFSLEILRQWLLMYEDGDNQTQFKAFYEGSAQQLADLKEQRDALDETIRELEQLRNDVGKSLK